jgi:hypothetical protein
MEKKNKRNSKHNFQIFISNPCTTQSNSLSPKFSFFHEHEARLDLKHESVSRKCNLIQLFHSIKTFQETTKGT